MLGIATNHTISALDTTRAMRFHLPTWRALGPHGDLPSLCVSDIALVLCGGVAFATLARSSEGGQSDRDTPESADPSATLDTERG
jgi:hypothetical protein